MPLARAIPRMVFPIVHPGKEQFGCRKRIGDLSLSLDHGPVLDILNTTGAGIPRVQGLNSTGNAGQEPMQSGLISIVCPLFRRVPGTGDSLVVSMQIQLLVTPGRGGHQNPYEIGLEGEEERVISPGMRPGYRCQRGDRMHFLPG